jgi:hypothetical protein
MKDSTTNRRNYAAESAWNMVMDFRQQIAGPRRAIDI